MVGYRPTRTAERLSEFYGIEMNAIVSPLSLLGNFTVRPSNICLSLLVAHNDRCESCCVRPNRPRRHGATYTIAAGTTYQRMLSPRTPPHTNQPVSHCPVHTNCARADHIPHMGGRRVAPLSCAAVYVYPCICTYVECVRCGCVCWPDIALAASRSLAAPAFLSLSLSAVHSAVPSSGRRAHCAAAGCVSVAVAVPDVCGSAV